MEQTVVERPVSQEQCVSQLHMQRYDTLNNSDVQFEKDASERWCPRRWTGQRGTIPSGTFGWNRFRQDKVSPVCRDNLRGSCARGASCKYQHSESDGYDGSRFYQKEQEKLSTVANSGNSQSYRATENSDSRTRFSSRGHRSRSPCHRYQSGRCYNGASCPYRHCEPTRYDKHTYDSSLEQKQVGRAVRGAGFVERNRDKMLRMSQESDEANRENGFRTMRFSGEYRSRSPCRNFLRGKCIYGASCKRLHQVSSSRHDLGTQHHQVAATSSHPGFGEGSRDVLLRTSQVHEETNLHNHSRTGGSFREIRSRSPCRYFLSGKCYHGASCVHFHPITVHDRTRYDSRSAQQHQGVSATSRTSHFGNGIANSARISRNHEDCMGSGVQPCQDMHVIHEQNSARLTKDDVGFAGNRVNEDVALRRWSDDGQRRRSASDFGGNDLGREVCIQFTKGRCNRGEHCRHLHGFHYFASSTWKKPNTEVAAAPKNFSGAIQHGNTIMAQEHDDVKNYNMSFCENKHAENRLVSSDDCFDKEITGHSVCDVVKPEIYDLKGDVPALDGRECEISGETIANFHSSAEGHKDISLRTLPFKRPKSRSRSPFTSRVDFHCRKPRRFDSRADSRSDRCYNVAQFQFPDRRCHKYERPMYHVNRLQPSKVGATSVKFSSNVDNNSKVVAPQRHVEVASQGLQLDQCPNGSLGSNIAAASKNNEAESARCILQPSHKDQNDEELAKDNIVVDSLEGAAAIGQEVLESDLTSSCGEDHISPAAVDLTTSGKEGNVQMIVDMGQESNDKTADLMPTMKIYSRKKSKKKRPRSVSSEETMKEQVANTFEQMTTSSLVETSSSNPNILSSVSGLLADMRTSASENKGVENMLMQDHPVKMKKNKKCKKKCSQSFSCEETRKTEVTTASNEGISSSSLVETSSAKKKAKKCKKKHPKAVCHEETMKEEGTLSSSLPEISSDQNILSASGVQACQKSIASENEDLVKAIIQLKKRKKKGTKSVSCEKNKKKEVTDTSKKQLPTSLLMETSLSNTNILSTSGITVNVEMSSSQNSDSEKVLMNDGPVKQQDNGSMTNEIVDNMESALATTEDGIHNPLLQSLPKAVIPDSRRKLLVLDLNGLLADIVSCYPPRFKPDITVSAKGVFKRPFCDDFLQFCFERFNVGVWSSRARKNVNMVVNFLMKDTKKRLLFCWDQSHCTATGYQTLENKGKPLFLKELKYLWDEEEECLPWDKGFYNETNTVLLDDSPYKALRNPPYTAIFPYPYTFKNVQDKSLGPRGNLRLYLERLAEAENVQKFIQENPFGQTPITNSNSSWDFYSKIACTCGIHHE